ncbi:MAG: hypothetical protein ACI4CY_05725 [Candidatus Gastranaerophilaceae bacterium]
MKSVKGKRLTELSAYKYALIVQKKEILRKIRNIDKEIKEILTKGAE